MIKEKITEDKLSLYFNKLDQQVEKYASNSSIYDVFDCNSNQYKPIFWRINAFVTTSLHYKWRNFYRVILAKI